MASTITGRNARQEGIVPFHSLSQCRATVIGVGAVGRQVALQLAAMGAPWLQLVDPDTVEEVNLGCQAYLEADVGRTKVEATGHIVRQLSPDTELTEVRARFRRSLYCGNAVFCCVDSIHTRKLIWESVHRRVEFFCDGRMSAEVLRVLTASDPETRETYAGSLFPPAEAHSGACTARSTIFCANIAAGMMLSQFSKWLRRLPVDPDICLNLLSMELVLGCVAS